MAPGFSTYSRGWDWGEEGWFRETHTDSQFPLPQQLMLEKINEAVRQLNMSTAREALQMAPVSPRELFRVEVKRNSLHTLFVARQMANPNFTL